MTARSPRWLSWALLAVLAACAAALILWAGRDTVFKADDWDILLYRQGFSSEVFLQPHSQHLIALQVLALKLVGALGGLHYSAYRIALLLVDLAIAFLFFLFARRRVGAWPALLVTAPLLFLGSASDSLLWSTMLGVMASLACGIAALMLLERGGGWWAKAGVCALLVCAVGFESNGLFFLAAVILWLLLEKRWRDLWVPAIPAVAYLAWNSSHGEAQVTSGNLAHTPGFVVRLAAAGFGGLSGIPFWVKHPQGIWEHVLLALVALVLLGLILGVGVLLWRARPRFGARTVAIASLPIFYWLLVSFGRADGGEPYASRYVYASVLFILMLLVELLRDVDLAPLMRGWPAAILVALVGVSIAANIHVLTRAGDEDRIVSGQVRGRAEAIELTRRTVDQNLYIGNLPTMANLRAGWYLNVVNNFGESPVPGTKIADLEPLAQTEADQQLAYGANAGLYPVGGARPVGTCRHPASRARW